ncbi:MAG: competence/damage-inducible protein A [Gammaproteobacteria bacterium]|nr:competence/damage-inducible protein A [Gammaproteobacteria bacterium]
MTRETQTHHKIAILATGDEICHGDITNSNSQEIAHRLVKHGMEVRMHMVSPDTVNEIENAMHFLLQSHDALIITGGLGPTSDDLTRYALSKVLDRPLVFNETCWQDICERLKRFGYPTPPESNRQQALFPEQTTVIPNPNGTASGCYAQKGEQWLFMLPGPPNECLPMVDSVVLPVLKAAHFQHISYHKSWLLFGVSEGKIAEEMDLLAKPYDCVTGYRLFYPYLEFKLHSNNERDFATLVTLVEKHIQPYLISDGQQTASSLLRQQLAEATTSLQIVDYATGGALEAALTTPDTLTRLHFTKEKTQLPRIEIEGLAAFWQAERDVTQTNLTMTLTDKEHEEKKEVTIPFRGKRVIQYAVELISATICDFLSTMKR